MRLLAILKFYSEYVHGTTGREALIGVNTEPLDVCLLHSTVFKRSKRAGLLTQSMFRLILLS